MKQGGWIQYTVRRSFEEGFTLLMRGPCGANGNSYDVRVQKLFGDWDDENSGIDALSKQPGLNIREQDALSIYEALARARISPFPPVVAGLDGETHELVLGGLFNRARFTWFVTLPECWAELDEPVRRLTEIALEYFSAAS